MSLKNLHLGLIGMIAASALTTAAMAFPDYGRDYDGRCTDCHRTIVNNRMELTNFAGVVDPPERQGVPDEGSLKYYTTAPGGSVGMTIHALNGSSTYSYHLIGFDQPDVTGGGRLIYADDPAWMAYRGNFNTYFVRADGGRNGYDWGTSDPTTVTYQINVDAATPPGYYLLTYALVGKGGGNGEWYHGEKFYLEVTGGASGPVLTVDASCPGGGPIVISWTDATPGGTIALLYARGQGSFRIPSGYACAGTVLGLGPNQLQIAYQGGAGSNGSRTLNASTGSGVCGGYFQLLDVPTCLTSNVVQAR